VCGGLKTREGNKKSRLANAAVSCSYGMH
jgi:hypothetical protein